MPPESGETAKYPAATAVLADFGGPVDNFGKLTLDGDHTSGILTITVLETIPATWPQTGWLTLDTEIVQFTAWAAKVFTVVRAQQGTAAAAHNSGTRVGRYLTEQAFNQIEAEIIAIEANLRGQTAVGSSGGILLPDGTIGTPALRFASDPDTGVYSAGLGQLAFTADGVERFRVNGSGANVIGAASQLISQWGTAAAPGISFSGELSTGFYRSAANQISLSTAGVQRVMVDAGGATFYVIAAVPQGTAAAPSLTFAADTNTGLFNVGADVLGITVGGIENSRFSGTAFTLGAGVNATASIEIGYTGGAATTPFIDFHSGAVSTDFDSRIIAGGGTGVTGGGTMTLVAQTALSLEGIVNLGSHNTNFLRAQGGGVGAPVILSAEGAGTDVELNITSKGASGVLFKTGSNSRSVLVLADTASSVNYIQLAGSATAQQTSIVAAGSDANVPLTLSSKGTGSVNIDSGNIGRLIATFVDTASSVNYLAFAGSITGGQPAIRVDGPDTNITLAISSKGAGAVNINTGSNGRQVAQFLDTASSVNYLTVTPGATGSGAVIGSAGSDSNISLILTSKGSGSVYIYTGSTARLSAAFQDAASAVNYFEVTPSATGGAVKIAGAGTDTNVSLNLGTKGAGKLQFNGLPFEVLSPAYWDFDWIPPHDTNYDLVGTSGTGAILTTGFRNINLSTGATSGSVVQLKVAPTSAAVYSATKWRVFRWRGIIRKVANCNWKAYLTQEDTAATTDPSNTARHLGVKAVGTTISFTTADGTTEQTTDVSASFLDGNEYLIHIDYDGVTARLYVNGALVATHSTNVPTGSAAGTHLVTRVTNAAATDFDMYLSNLHLVVQF